MFGVRTLRSAFSKLSVSSLSACQRGNLMKSDVGGLPLQRFSLPLNLTTNTIAMSSCRCPPVAVASAVPTSSLVSGISKQNGLLMATSLSVDKSNIIPSVRQFSTTTAKAASLNQMHRSGPVKKTRPNRNPLGKKPMAKGVILKTIIKKPRKPNSANRKCVLVRLSTGKEMIAYVPGEGHNLQEHNVVTVIVARLRDVPGVKLKCIRGVNDLPHVIKRKA